MFKAIVFSIVVLVFSVVFTQSHAAQEKVIGHVVAVERSFDLNLDDCADSFKKEFTGGGKYLSLGCRVYVYPKSDEEESLSSSLNNTDSTQRETLLTTIRDSDVKIDIYAGGQGYEIYTSSWSIEYLPELKDITKEAFLKAAKVLTDRFPKVTIKVMKVQK